MRNLLLLAAAIGLTTAASAQNSATVSQSGDFNNAELAQTGASSATITITGDENEVLVSQAAASDAFITVDGSHNQIARAEYSPAPGFPENAFQQTNGSQVAISQTGDYNSVLGGQYGPGAAQNVAQNGATADITQISSVGYVGSVWANRLMITQLHAGVDATVVQENTGSNMNLGFIRQDNGTGHIAGIDQLGEGNVADVQQGAGSNNEGYVSQDGDFNDVVVYQLGSGSFSDVDLDGDYNEVTIDQLLGGNTATVSIIGGDMVDVNTVDINQTTAGNTANVNLTGNGHTATINQ